MLIIFKNHSIANFAVEIFDRKSISNRNRYLSKAFTEK